MGTGTSFWLLMLFSASAAALFTAFAAKLSRRFQFLLDRPNHRSLHKHPTPRVGGIGLWAAVLVTVVWSGPALSPGLVIPAFVVASVSLLDDWRAQSIGLRLTTQLFAAAAAAQTLFPGQWWISLLAVAVVWSANLFNFMDGADGLALTMALVGFVTLGWLALGSGHPIAPLAFILAGASAGTLVLNFPPARIFLGDAGSVPLGFVAAILSIWGVRDGLWPIWQPALIFLPFILDASITLLLRIWQRKQFWTAHREHLYQLLVIAGWSHGSLLLGACAIMLVSAVAALCILKLSQGWQLPAAALMCLCLATIFLLLRRRLAQRPH